MGEQGMDIAVRRGARALAAAVLASFVVMSSTALAQTSSTPASAEITCGTRPEGVTLPDAEPLLHYSERQDVVIWPLAKL